MQLDKRNLITILLFAGIAGVTTSQSVHALTQLDIMGDIGTNAVAKRNLEILADGDECLLGMGDYIYNENVPTGIQQLYDNIECKVGVPGNHEEEKGESPAWARNNFHYLSFSAWRIRDVVLINLNAYEDFQKGSVQYKWFVEKWDQYKDRPGVNWIIVAAHPDFFTPTVEGGHGPDKELRDTFLPLIKDNPKVILVGAHNHITAWGKVQGNNVLICGGGGKGGDSLGGEGKNSGFEFATAEIFGHCDVQFSPERATVLLIDDQGEKKGSFNFTKAAPQAR